MLSYRQALCEPEAAAVAGRRCVGGADGDNIVDAAAQPRSQERHSALAGPLHTTHEDGRPRGGHGQCGAQASPLRDDGGDSSPLPGGGRS